MSCYSGDDDDALPRKALDKTTSEQRRITLFGSLMSDVGLAFGFLLQCRVFRLERRRMISFDNRIDLVHRKRRSLKISPSRTTFLGYC